MGSQPKKELNKSELEAVAWVATWGQEGIEAIIDTTQIVTFARIGVIYARKKPEILAKRKSLDESRRHSYTNFDEFKAWIDKRTQALLDEKEQATGIMAGQSVTYLWSVMESHVTDFVSGWIRHGPKVLEKEEIRKVEISVGEFLGLSDEERIELIADSLFDFARKTKKRGVDRFEFVLELVGLGGPLDKTIRETLWLMYQVRNCYAHRRGKADKRFVDAVSDRFEVKLGELVVVPDDLVSKFMITSVAYFKSLTDRAFKILGVPEAFPELSKASEADSGIELKNPDANSA